MSLRVSKIITAVLLFIWLGCLSAFAEKNQDLEAMLSTQPGEVVTFIQQEMQNNEMLPLAEQVYYQTLLSKAYYSLYEPDNALKYADNAVRLAEGLAEDDKQSELYQRALLSRAFALGLGAKAKAALPLAQSVLKWARENNDIKTEVEALQSVGFSALSLEEHALALDAMQQAYRLLKKYQTSELPHPSRFAAYLAQVYDFRREPEHALPLYLDAANYARQHGRELELSDALYGAARAYSQLGEAEQALLLFEQSMTLSRKKGDDQGAAYTLIEIAYLTLEQQNPEQINLTQLIADLHKARSLFFDVGNDHLILEVDEVIVEAYIKAGDFENALKTVKQAQALITEDSLQSSAPSLLKIEARILSEQGNYDSAYRRLSQAYDDREALLNRSREEAFERLHAEFNVEQKEIENQLLIEQNALQQVQLTLVSKQKTIVMLIISLLLVAIGFMVLVFRNLRHQKKRLTQLAERDSLTGLYNRRAILLYLDALKLKRTGDVAVALLDLDNFKKINDTHGHNTGDEVLRLAASEGVAALDEHCRIGRIGGEEFLIVFNPGIQSDTCYHLITRYMNKVKNCETTLDRTHLEPITFSIGLTILIDGEETSDTLARADKLMYQAKKRGKDCVVSDSHI